VLTIRDGIGVEKIVAMRPSISLLIIQPTPFCNINCDYCYLPNRNSTKRISIAILKQAIESVFATSLIGERLSIVWHAGEPLALPVDFYEEAFQAIETLPIGAEKITHSIQSNGVLINDRWCKFIKEQRISLGLSIDGPAFVHDLHRKTRRGLGTHAQVMKGVAVLRRNDIDFHAIAVITKESLDYPDEIFNFFLDQGIRRIGFNIEELEGENRASSLAEDSVDERMKSFLQRLHVLQKKAGGAVKIREFDNAYRAIAQSSDTDVQQISARNDQVVPLRMISIDCEGNFSTFSPELLGAKSSVYGDFCFGNIMTDDLSDITKNDKFSRVLEDIEAGLRLCSETCEYYFLCGGGAPSNKYFENGTFASTETMYCRYTVKMPIDIVLADLEEALDINVSLGAVTE
jgi:uncharacterized protein